MPLRAKQDGVRRCFAPSSSRCRKRSPTAASARQTTTATCGDYPRCCGAATAYGRIQVGPLGEGTGVGASAGKRGQYNTRHFVRRQQIEKYVGSSLRFVGTGQCGTRRHGSRNRARFGVLIPGMIQCVTLVHCTEERPVILIAASHHPCICSRFNSANNNTCNKYFGGVIPSAQYSYVLRGVREAYKALLVRKGIPYAIPASIHSCVRIEGLIFFE